ncbi:YveK family protein [Streptomyces sp. YKOK-I1]
MTGPIHLDDRYDEPDQLRDQLRRILRHRALIALGLVLGLLGGLALAEYRAHTYTATGEVLVRSTADPFGAVGVSADNQVSMTTEQQVATSAEVARRVARALRLPESQANGLAARLRVTNPMKSRVLRFEFTAGSPRRAAEGANAFAEAYLTDRKSRNDAAVRRATDALGQQIRVLNQDLAEEKLGQKDAKTAAQSQLYTLQKRVLDIKSRDTDAGDVVRRASAPHLPVGPGLRVLLALGLVCGLLLGLVLAWLRSALDSRIRSVGELRGALRAPVLGILPDDEDGRDELLKVGRTGGTRAEAFRALAFRLRKTDSPSGPGQVLVVAPRDAEAAEEVAANLAAALAEYGGEVLLVDADSDASRLSDRLPLMPYEAPTLEEAFLPSGSVLVDADVSGRLAFRSGGGIGAHTRSSLSTEAHRLRPGTESTTVVVTGPFLTHADALAVAQRVDGVVLVVGLGATRQDDLRQVQELVDCSGGRLLGTVLDAARPRRLRLPRRRPKYRPASHPAAPMELPAQDGTFSISRR